jgi:cysteine desulfurase / selenocysteine lyase
MLSDLGKLRRDTPACAELIHFNNAGAALQPTVVTEAVISHLLREQEMGGYEAAAANNAAADNFYTALGRLFNCSHREIAWAENATRAWHILLQSIPFETGDKIVTGQSEYASNYLTLMHWARTRHIEVVVLPNDHNGQIPLDLLDHTLQDNVRLIALTHIASQSGVVQPAAAVGRLARKHRVLYLLDACQSAGQVAVDVNEIGCDMMTGSGRKYLRGPRGTGFMYVRHSALDFLKPATLDLQSATWIEPDQFEWRDDARRFEIWEHFVAGKIGLAAAADYACNLGMTAITTRIRLLATLLRNQLSEIPGVRIHDEGFNAGNGPLGQQHLAGIVSFSHAKIDANTLHTLLSRKHINTSVIRRQNTQLDFSRRDLADINRASVHYYNTEAEIHKMCESLRAAI